MKPLLLSSALVLVLLSQPACERHPASETVPGYAEKHAAQPTPDAASKPSSDAPSYFPGSGKK